MFPIRNGLKQGDAFFTIAFQLCFRVLGSGKLGWLEITWYTSGCGFS